MLCRDIRIHKTRWSLNSHLLGGAFVYAAGGAAIYDGRVLSTISKEDFNIPTIIISVSFRLGVFGFLASEELREYNREFGEEGVGNYGLWDQVEALRWTKKHIAAVGGNPEKICVFGQSAGGVSGNIHLARNEPLFSSVIIQSGLMPLCGIMSVEQYQVIYDKMLRALDIPEDLPAREQLQRLIDAPEADVTAAMVPVLVTPVITLSPCDDGVLVGWPNAQLFRICQFQNARLVQTNNDRRCQERMHDMEQSLPSTNRKHVTSLDQVVPISLPGRR